MAEKPTSKPNHVKRRHVVDADGHRRTMHVVDAESPTFGRDIEHIFRLNVAKARRENKRILGVADFVPAKR